MNHCGAFSEMPTAGSGVDAVTGRELIALKICLHPSQSPGIGLRPLSCSGLICARRVVSAGMLRHCWYSAFHSDWLHPSAFHPSGTFRGRRGRRLRPNAGYCQRRDTCGNDNHDCYGFYILPVSYRVAGQSLERALYYAAVYSQSGAGYRRRQWAGDVRHQGSDFVGRGEALD